ncbi:hypothetical protein CBL_05268 [Carabus blaptoides fortunei]
MVNETAIVLYPEATRSVVPTPKPVLRSGSEAVCKIFQPECTEMAIHTALVHSSIISSWGPITMVNDLSAAVLVGLISLCYRLDKDARRRDASPVHTTLCTAAASSRHWLGLV